MSDISARVHELRALENLSVKQTAVHRLHPLAKLLSALVFIVSAVSFGRYDFLPLAPYLFYPFILMALAELPHKLLLSRVLIALPFCLFAGISNVVFDRTTAFVLFGAPVSLGLLSLATILLKMYLCVMAALMIMATMPFTELTAQLRRLHVPMIFVVMAALMIMATMPFTELTAQLRRLHVPMIFVMIFEMIFRYIGILLEEAQSLITAYKLRSGTKKALEVRHMGSLVGHLILRTFDRAERIHSAMSCRGYSLMHIQSARRRFQVSDVIALTAVCLPSVLLRLNYSIL